jgi:hypothetical protein
MVLILCLPIIPGSEAFGGEPWRVTPVDLPRLLAAGWTLRQIEERLDMLENCRADHRNFPPSTQSAPPAVS